MRCKGLPTKFKIKLYDLCVDDLFQIYQIFLDLDVDLKWANPFVDYLRVVGEVLEERFPEYWARTK